MVSVIGGEGEVTGGGQAYSVHSGQTATFQGTDQLDADVQSDGNQDDFDQWCAERDHREDRSVSARYVSDEPSATKISTITAAGVQCPNTARVVPTRLSRPGSVRYGHWVYIAPWGYTWVKDEPWGFSPFHDGRWVTVGGVWGWVPCAPPRRRLFVCSSRLLLLSLPGLAGLTFRGVALAVPSMSDGSRSVPVKCTCPYRVSRRYCNDRRQ